MIAANTFCNSVKEFIINPELISRVIRICERVESI